VRPFYFFLVYRIKVCEFSQLNSFFKILISGFFKLLSSLESFDRFCYIFLWTIWNMTPPKLSEIEGRAAIKLEIGTFQIWNWIGAKVPNFCTSLGFCTVHFFRVFK
jgi:hypothetical protein